MSADTKSSRNTSGSRLSLTSTTSLYIVLLAIGSSCIFLPWSRGGFSADDWLVIARNMHVDASEVPAWFVTMRSGWYRPLWDLWVTLNWQVFGESPPLHRISGIALHTGIVIAVFLLGSWLPAGGRAAGVLAALVHSCLAVHAEAVMWISAVNELLAALFVSWGLVFLLLYLRLNGRIFLVLTWICYLLSLTAKETALAFPLMALAIVIAVDTSDSNDTGTSNHRTDERRTSYRRLLALLPIFLTGAVYLVARVNLGTTPYDVDITAVGLAKNLVYYVLMLTVALPASTSYLLSSDVPIVVRGPAIISVAVATLSMAMILVQVVRQWLRTRHDDIARGVSATAIIAIAGIAPVLPIVTERTAYMSSIGTSLMLGLLFSSILPSPTSRRWMKSTAFVVVVLYLTVNLFALNVRAYWWLRAGSATSELMVLLEDEIDTLDPDTKVIVENLPDRLHYGLAFRNMFPWAAEVRGWSNEVVGRLDSETESTSRDGVTPTILSDEPSVYAVYYRYEDSELIHR